MKYAIILTLLASPAMAVTGNASIDNPGQTDPAPAAAPSEPDMSDGGGAVRWTGDEYNLNPSHTCMAMVCAAVQGGDR